MTWFLDTIKLSRPDVSLAPTMGSRPWECCFESLLCFSQCNLTMTSYIHHPQMFSAKFACSGSANRCCTSAFKTRKMKLFTFQVKLRQVKCIQSSSMLAVIQQSFRKFAVRTRDSDLESSISFVLHTLVQCFLLTDKVVRLLSEVPCCFQLYLLFYNRVCPLRRVLSRVSRESYSI